MCAAARRFASVGTTRFAGASVLSKTLSPATRTLSPLPAAAGPTGLAFSLAGVRVASAREYLTAGTRPLLCKPAAGAGGDAAAAKSAKAGGAIQGVYSLKHRTAEDEERERKEREAEEEAEDAGGAHNEGYLPFPAPFHTVNIMALLLLGNVIMYFVMHFSSDEMRDFIVEHFTLSHENWHKVYPLFTHSLYQENLLQLLIDVWLLWQFGRTQLGFLGNTRLTFFWMLCTLGAAGIHVARQKIMLHYEMDPIEVRGRVYGPNPFILGLVGLEGLIFRNMNFLQNPPVPFLVLTAGVMIIDVWRIFTMKPEEHGASTGGALIAYIMWALPTRLLGLDRLTAAI